MTETITQREFDSFREPPPSLAGRQLALVLVDLQYGSTHPDYGWVRFHRQRGQGATMEGYLQRLETTLFPNVRALLEAFRRAGERIVVDGAFLLKAQAEKGEVDHDAH